MVILMVIFWVKFIPCMKVTVELKLMSVLELMTVNPQLKFRIIVMIEVLDLGYVYIYIF